MSCEEWQYIGPVMMVSEQYVLCYVIYIAIPKTAQTISKKVEHKAVKLLILAVNASVKTCEEIPRANF